MLLRRGNLSLEVRLEASLPLPTRLFPMVRSGELRFDRYVELGSRRYPTVLSESIAGNLLLRVEVQELKAQAPDESALSPPKNASARPWCPHPKPAVSTWVRMPEALTMGRTFIYGVIGADGRWYNIDVVDSSHNSWPPASPFQQYLSASKTEPATCEGRPVPSEVIVHFGR